jgi:peptidoglycan/xylan/chitin deacetylase (PgdA/CDA1 family)
MSDRLVLAYHAVSDDWRWRFAVTSKQFESHVQQLRRRRYALVTFADLISTRARRVAAITFDDAFASVSEHAGPVLAAVSAPATIFVPTAFVGGELSFCRGLDDPRDDDLRAMDWTELARLRDDGWEIASHTCTHPVLPELADEALTRELSDSKAELERRLGTSCRTLAYPYGATDDRVRAAADAAGYDAAADFPPRFSAATRFGWPRVGVYREDDGRRFRGKTSRAARSARTILRALR